MGGGIAVTSSTRGFAWGEEGMRGGQMPRTGPWQENNERRSTRAATRSTAARPSPDADDRRPEREAVSTHMGEAKGTGVARGGA